MNALVTGGSGFIGRNVVRDLLNDNHDVVVIDKHVNGSLIAEMPGVEFRREDITNRHLPWKSVLSDIDVVYHFAGMLGTSELFNRIIDAEKVNVLGTLNLLEAMRTNDVNKIVFASKPNVWKHNPYTITKEIAERYLQMYYEIYGILPIVLCPYNVYGPEEPLDEYRKAVPYFIISAILGKPLEIYGTGSQTMDLIHVRDCARAVTHAGNINFYQDDKIEIGTGFETTVNDLAKTIIRLTDSKSRIQYVPMRMGEVPNTKLLANTFIMNDVLEVCPSIELEDGLIDTIAYYRENLKKYIRT